MGAGAQKKEGTSEKNQYSAANVHDGLLNQHKKVLPEISYTRGNRGQVFGFLILATG
jgi:hypothetical protein